MTELRSLNFRTELRIFNARGRTGAVGPQGEEGPQGPQGEVGETGPEGPAGSGSGDVLGPAAHAADLVPQWNGANTKTLKAGRAIGAGAGSALLDRDAGDGRYRREGVFTVTRSGPSNLTVDFTGYAGRMVYVADGAPGDNNVATLAGLAPGGTALVTFESNVALLTEDPFTPGHTNIYANFNADATEHDSLAVGPDELVLIVRPTAANRYLAYLIGDKLGGRVSIPGASAREPLETIRYFGKVGKFNPEKNVIWADLGIYQQGTVRKVFMSGAFVNAINDSGAFYWALLKTATGFGLEDLDYAIPRTDLQTMSSQMIVLRGYTFAADGVTMELAGQVDPAGWVTGPGSLKGQGFASYFKMHHTALPTRQSAPAGFTWCASPPGTTTPIGRFMGQPDGSLWSLGKAALESRGTVGSRAPLATLANISQWNFLSFDYDTISTVGRANHNIPLTPAESAACGFFGALSFTRYDSQSEGFEIFDRRDENMIHLAATQYDGSRMRAIGFRPNWYGYFSHIEGGQAPAHEMAGRMQFATGGGENQIVNVRPDYMGQIAITLQNGKTAIVGIAEGNGNGQIIAGDLAYFSGVNGTADRWNVDKSGGDVRIQKNTAGAGDALVKLTM